MAKKILRGYLLVKDFFTGMPKSDVILNWIFLGMILLVMAVFVFTGYAATKDWQLPLAISLIAPIIGGGLRLFELIILYKGYLESGRRYSSADYAVPCDKGQPQGILGLGL